MQRPRFRNDLVSKPLEENGQRFVNVTDPDSGKTFRFYEVEYAVACAMNGSRNVNDLIDWTRAELGLEPSKQEVETVISTLGDLGYLDSANGAPDTPGLDLALGSPGRSPMDSGGGPREPAQDFELGVAGKSPMGGPPKKPAPQAADLELGAAGFGAAEAPTPALQPESTPGPGPGPGPGPEPTPTSGPPPTDDNMSTDLSQHLQIGTDDVKEAVRQSKVMEAVQMPSDFMPEDPAAAQRPQQMREPPPGATPIELPTRPPSAQPPPARQPATEPPPPRPRSGSNLTIILLIAVLIVAVGGAAYYFLVYAKDDGTEGTKRPRGAGAKKIDDTDKAPEPPPKVVAMLKAGATVDEVIKAPKEGRLEWIEAAGTEVSAGAIVVKYRGFDRVKTKITKALASKARYQEKLERAKERDNQKSMARAAADVERKDQDIANLQAEAMTFAVKAPASGVVTPLVEAKASTKEGQELIKLATTSGPSAVFEVPDPAKHEVGDKVEIAAESDPSLTAVCDIEKIEGKRVSIACPTDSGIEEGAAVALKLAAEK